MIADGNDQFSLARRMRRMRGSPARRALRRETELTASHFVQPIFVTEDASAAGAIDSMPGVSRLALADVATIAARLRGCGVRSVLLFGIPAAKDSCGHSAGDEDGIVPRAVREVRRGADDMVVITDLCLCAYTDHGHCAPIANGRVLNDESFEMLGRAALAHAAAGADLVAPSGMMDGAVRAVRRSLDANGFADTGILSYAVKYASAFYGPFRDAARSAPSFGDRRSHQMDPANAAEAIEEARLDLDEGADVLMVKPALAYLDVIRRLRERYEGVPIAAYQVSGEYASLVAASERGWLDLQSVALETLTAMRRAGADILITYFAEQAAHWLRESADATAEASR
ncbi:MAG: porphobilinogen synthase [Phycisphaerae bacterium]|nr:porphobilinogen synthase [Phycisphaerae bacterium]